MDAGAPSAAEDGSNLITFSEQPIGTAITDQYVSQGAIFAGGSGDGDPFITTDTSNPTSPVLSGSPKFMGDITVQFVLPRTKTPTRIDSVSLDVGYIDSPGSVEVLAYTEKGIEVLPADHVGINHITTTARGISAIDIVQSAVEPAGFAIDNLAFSPGTTPATGLAGGSLKPTETNGQSNPAESQCACGIRFGGDPVNTLTGNFTDTFRDIHVAAGGPRLDLDRTYNSLDAAEEGLFGRGWTSPWDVSLSSTGNDPGATATVRFGNGSTIEFTRTGLGWFAAPRVMAELTELDGGGYRLVVAGSTVYSFETDGTLTSIADLSARTVTLDRSAPDELVVTGPAGQRERLHLVRGLVTQAVDPSGNTVRYAYTAGGDLSSVTDPNGGTTRYTYDDAHRLVSMINPVGGRIVNRYDSRGRVVSQTDARGGTTSFDYTRTPHTTRVTDTRGLVTDNTYIDGLLVSSTQGVGTSDVRRSTYTYDPVTGGQTGETRPDGSVTTRTFDSRGNLLTETDGLGRTTTRTYDAIGNVTSTTYPSGRLDTAEYDDAGNLMDNTVDANRLHLTTTYEYDANGYLAGVTSPMGARTTYVNDTAGNVVAQVDPDGARTELSRDALGRVTRETQVSGHGAGADRVQRAVYVGLRLIRTVAADGGTTTYNYDRAGRVTATTAPGRGRIQDVYNPAGDITATRASSGTTVMRYTRAGDLTSRTDPGNRRTTFSYDAFGERTARIDALHRKTNWTFDAMGRVVRRTSAAGTITIRRYDAAGQQVKVSYAKPATHAVVWTYTVDGQRRTMSDGSGTTTYGYDTAGRTTSITHSRAGTVAYTLDGDGRAIALRYPNGKQVTRTFSAAGRLTAVTDWLGKTTTFAFDPFAELSNARYGNGVTATTSYTKVGQRARVTYRDATGRPLAAFGSVTAAASGLVTSVSASGAIRGTTRVRYSGAAQVNRFGTSVVQYDAAGDLLRTPTGVSQAFDAAAQLSHATATTTRTVTIPGKTVKGKKTKSTRKTRTITKVTSYAYSKSGARTTERVTGKIIRRWAFDAEDRLTAVKGNTGALVASYGYDGDGLRRSKRVGNVTSTFAWDQQDDLPLLLSDGGTSYLYGPDGLPFEQITGSVSPTWLLSDTLGNVRVLTDGRTRVTGTASYGLTGARTTRGARSALGFHGEYTDSETGLQYLRARYYDPATAAFLTVDPMVDTTASAYGFAGGNPVSFADPTGLFFISCGALIGQVGDALDGLGDVSEGVQRRASVLGRMLRTSDDPAVRSYAAQLLRGAGELSRNPVFAAVRGASEAMPYIGGTLTAVGHLTDGESVAQSVGAGVGAGVVGAIGGSLGATACGAETIATLGFGSVACPVLIVGGGYVGGKVGEFLGGTIGGWVGKL